MSMHLHLYALTLPESADDFTMDDLSSSGVFEPADETQINLQKSWHGLHYLLSEGQGESPLGFLLEGGTPLGEDRGYGAPRLFQPEEVQQIQAAMANVSDDQLWSRFNSAKMLELYVYPGIWDEPEKELREEYLMYYHQLKRLVALAAERHLALLVAMR